MASSAFLDGFVSIPEMMSVCESDGVLTVCGTLSTDVDVTLGNVIMIRLQTMNNKGMYC